MGSSCEQELKVEVKRKDVVAAELPLQQEHWLPLSNLDIFIPAFDVGVFFCYKKPIYTILKHHNDFASMVTVLKKSLAQALVSYYLFAGKLVSNSAGDPELHCNNRGVDFIEAYADVDLWNIDFYNPEATVEGKLVPKIKAGVFSVQLPLRPSKEADDDQKLIKRIYYVTAKDIEWLQSQASNINDSSSSSGSYMHRSKLESFSAFLWQIIAKSVCYNDDTNNKRCKIGIVVEGRRRLDGKVMDTYVGNVLSLPSVEARAEELKSRPLSWAANAVHECVKSAITKEHFQGLIDWVEAHRPEPVLPKVDFGWGKPVFGSYYFPWGGDAGYVMPMPSAHGNGDWVVYANLLKGQLEFLEVEAAGIFRPLISTYGMKLQTPYLLGPLFSLDMYG